jgi:hypothetical protein
LLLARLQSVMPGGFPGLRQHRNTQGEAICAVTLEAVRSSWAQEAGPAGIARR